MNGWMQARKGGPWHQVEHVPGGNLKGCAVLLCSNVSMPDDKFQILDYRSRPLPQCKRTACQREVEA